jgi:inorganic pyrophosphatase/exopolyphosphatase
MKIKLKVKKQSEIGNDKGALRAAKQGAKAQVKSEFKAKVAEAKSDMPKKEAKMVIGKERKNYMAAKKEIRKYTDY